MQTYLNSKTIKNFLARLPPKMRRFLETIIYSNIKKGFDANPSIPIAPLVDIIAKFVRRPGKRFVWIHVMDTHHPYVFDPEIFRFLHGYIIHKYTYFKSYVALLDWSWYNGEIPKELIKLLIDMQEAAIATVDEYLNRLIKKLGSTLNETLIIVTADHGEEYMEHGAYGHTGIMYLTHMFEELLRIPLVILDFTDSLPLNQVKRKIAHDTIMQIDILPTLCEIMRVKCAKVDGNSLFKLSGNPRDTKRRVIIAEASLFNAGRGTSLLKPSEKVILSIKRFYKKIILYDDYFMSIYDLSNDPYEHKPLILYPHDAYHNEVDEETKNMLIQGLRRIQYVKRIILRDYIRHKIRRKVRI